MSIISKIKMPGMADAYDIGVDWENVKDKPDVGSIDVGVTNEVLNIDTNNDIAVSGNSSSGPQEQADYSENDTTANSYIKNRPFTISSTGYTYSTSNPTGIVGTIGDAPEQMLYPKISNFLSQDKLIGANFIIKQNGEITNSIKLTTSNIQDVTSEFSNNINYSGSAILMIGDGNGICIDAPLVGDIDGMAINLPEAGIYCPSYEEYELILQYDFSYTINEDYKEFFDKFLTIENGFTQTQINNQFALKTELQQSDWNTTDTSSLTYIKNKPRIINSIIIGFTIDYTTKETKCIDSYATKETEKTFTSEELLNLILAFQNGCLTFCINGYQDKVYTPIGYTFKDPSSLDYGLNFYLLIPFNNDLGKYTIYCHKSNS